MLLKLDIGYLGKYIVEEVALPMKQSVVLKMSQASDKRSSTHKL